MDVLPLHVALGNTVAISIVLTHVIVFMASHGKGTIVRVNCSTKIVNVHRLTFVVKFSTYL